MDFVGANGSVVIPVDVSSLADGTISISVTLTNGAGNSTATVLNLTKNTAVPPLVVSSVPAAVNSANVSSFGVSGTDEKFDTVTYTVTDGVNTVSGSYYVNGNQSWSINPNLMSLSDGQVTLTLTATNGYGSQDVLTYTLSKKTTAPAAPQLVVLNSGSDSGVSSSDYVTSINNPSFTVTPGTGATSYAIYVNGTLYSARSGIRVLHRNTTRRSRRGDTRRRNRLERTSLGLILSVFCLNVNLTCVSGITGERAVIVGVLDGGAKPLADVLRAFPQSLNRPYCQHASSAKNRRRAEVQGLAARSPSARRASRRAAQPRSGRAQAARLRRRPRRPSSRDPSQRATRAA